MANKPADKPGKKPFIAKADRPEVRLKSDTPISDLTVRDLATILGQLGTGKDFWDGKDWQKDDFDGPGNKWKEPRNSRKQGEGKGQGRQGRKNARRSARQGAEGREARARRRVRPVSQPDPRMEQVVRALSGMSAKVDQLVDQVEALKKGKAKP